MSKTLRVQYLIPFSDEEWEGSCMTFHRWLPDGENECLIRQQDNITARLWFDGNCVASLYPVDKEEISKSIKVFVSKVYVDIRIANVSEELAAFIYDERDSPRNIHYGINPDHIEYSRLRSEYKILGWKVLKFALMTYNRFIAFARNNKAQYRLRERPLDENRMSSMDIGFHAKVYSEGNDWVRWCPSSTDRITCYYTVETSGKNSIKQEEWNRIQEFISSNSRPNLILELLANAQLLIDQGHGRSAIIEAASALETAVFSFSKKGSLDKLILSFLKEGKLDELVLDNLLLRFDANQLKSQIKEMGLSGSLRFLLPILFPAEVLPTEILNHCQTLILIRNNVVHNGQRDVDEEKARLLISSVRRTCEIITQYIESH
jgi:hypothetical protein